VDEINGTVNLNAAGTAVLVQRGELTIGSANLTGDPLFVNPTGDLVFAVSDLVIPEHLTLIAAGDVTFNTGPINATINTTPPQRTSQIDPNTGLPVSAPPSTLTIAAGVTVGPCNACANGFSQTGGPCQDCDPSLGPSLTITGSSSTGGNINMSHVNLVNNG